MALYIIVMTNRHRTLIKIYYADPANTVKDIAARLDLAPAVVEATIREAGFSRAPVINDELPAERLRRKEVEKQEAFTDMYNQLEATIVERLITMAESAETADDLGKIARAYKDIRTCGLPPSLVEAATANGGVSVQILNQM